MKYAFIYPGQGSQTQGMGRDFVDNFPVAKELLQEASDTLGQDMAKILYEDETKLNETQYTQPAIFLVSAMAHRIAVEEYGIQATLAFGHSLGEVSAYCLNGGANFADSIYLTHKRGQFMAEACKGRAVGMMVCLGLATNVLEDICKKAQDSSLQVWAANYNMEGQVVLAGIKDDLEALSTTLKEAGAKRTLLLKMSVASHCPLLQDSIPPFQELLNKSITNTQVDIISNANLDIYNTKEEALQNLTQQLIKPVLYHQCVRRAKELGITQFIEFGNGSVLAGLNNKISDIPTISINSVQSLRQLGSL
ncbi:ACP S-malonyltransferase [Helicobacter trogontum]|uniref:Malonyl CoA-acyl carrier protein transacylase n=1 Tax=Helicobacter trogontum TaxID=50960 RepID=A0A4U8S3H7_9HELI|nr:ACP S-malonyltransferase [Helicobacter trogontum]TLD80325.1 [acyl-carrier-protein] S-malonyltransferase [Helicobacter trogontum]